MATRPARARPRLPRPPGPDPFCTSSGATGGQAGGGVKYVFRFPAVPRKKGEAEEEGPFTYNFLSHPPFKTGSIKSRNP